MKRWRRARGQATVEVVIGLVGMAAIFFGILQIAVMSDANVRNFIEARGDAEDSASYGDLLSRDNDFVAGWSNGADNLRFTTDDVVSQGGSRSLDTFAEVMQNPVSLGDLSGYGIVDEFSPYLTANSSAVAADLYRGRAARDIGVEPALRFLLLNRVQRIRLRDTVYMPSFRISD